MKVAFQCEVAGNIGKIDGPILPLTQDFKMIDTKDSQYQENGMNAFWLHVVVDTFDNLLDLCG